ncbi:MAG: hypothetical protein HY275_04910 [Gemmatimonadetes bacterium]|nr:hypothetical protein [Gemmatimonadota bacterium]
MTEHRPASATDADATDPQQRRWAEVRAAGRASFIWRYGVLGWGLPAALLVIAYGVIQEHGLRWRAALAEPYSFKLRAGIAVAVVLFPAVGHLLGRRLWDAGEARYRAGRDPHGAP